MMNSLYECELCPRNCLADRSYVEGYCRSGLEIKISSWDLHFGEESCLSGTRGSGTIFFTNCNLRCVFCQNHTISQSGIGNQISTEDLVEIILKLQDLGAHNINLVTPTHFSSQLQKVLIKAKDQGLEIPVIWNSNAYEKVETLKQMVELVDIYLSDLKYLSPEIAARYSDAGDYPQFATAAVLEMHN
ncbi:MAG: radical SAM protein, partial [Candidatus Cloacimonetes bacterium]|nr:radical SAM protein [Candidatus Cloacimonadota bacterium]